MLRLVGLQLLHTMGNLTSALLSTRKELHAHLRQLLVSPDALAEIAARSYRHDNGFAKIVLRSGQHGRGAVRLHVWPADGGADRNIHNHCWDFASIVLAGRLEFEEFVVDGESAVNARHYVYDAATDFDYTLRLRGATRLRSVARGIRGAGDAYEMSSTALHRTAGVPGAVTVTLLCQGPHRRDFADVYVTRADGVPTRCRNTPLGTEELCALIDDITKITAREPGRVRHRASPIHPLRPRAESMPSTTA